MSNVLKKFSIYRKMHSYYISHNAFGIHVAIEGCDPIFQRQFMNIPTTKVVVLIATEQLKRDEQLLYIVIL